MPDSAPEGLSPDEADAWLERVAICVAEGIDEERARRIADAQIARERIAR